MPDRIFSAHMNEQSRQAEALASESDLVNVLPLTPSASTRFVVEFACTGLTRSGGKVTEANTFMVGVRFGPDYLRRPVHVAELLMWMHPREIFHPNIAAPFLCIGDVRPGTGLVELIYRTFELITWQRFTAREDDALNPTACQWARRNMARLPVDRRPLKWRSPGINRPDTTNSANRIGS